MKFLFIITCILLYPPVYSNDVIQYEQNKKLQIKPYTGNDRPENWLRNYGEFADKTEKLITISAIFPIPEIRSIRIRDYNAEKGLCGNHQLKDLLYLSFSKKDKIHKIITRIHKPCFKGNKAIFKLFVTTYNGKYFYNSSTLTAYSGAFNWSSPSD